MRIAFLGDIALFGRNTSSNLAYRQMFEPMKELLQQCNYIVANLEPINEPNKNCGRQVCILKR